MTGTTAAALMSQVDDSAFRALIEGSLQGILIHRDQRPVFLNEAWARIHGLTIDEVLRLDSVLDVIHPEDRERLLGYMTARLNGQSAPQHYEYRGLHKDGSVVWLENTVRQVDWGGLPAIQAVIIDVTQRKRAEQALRESEERFRRGFEHGPIGLFLLDTTLRFLKANRAFCEMTGYSEDELCQKQLIDLTLLEDTVAPDVAVDLALGEFQDFTIRKRYLKHDGAVVWCRISAHWVHDDDGIPQQRLTFVENISDRMQARQQLEASERRFRHLVEGSIQGIVVHRDEKPLFVNESWARMLGYTVEEVLAAPSMTQFLAPHECERLSSYRKARMAGESAPWRYEYQGLRKDGSLIWFENSVRLVEWDGRAAIQSTIIDISERKLREQELRSFSAELERRVDGRTAELAATNARLQHEVGERERIEVQLRQQRALYESLVETIPLCVARKDLDGNFVFVNRALRTLFDRTLEEIVGKNDYAFSLPELAAKYREDDLRVIETGEQLEFQETINFGTAGERHIHTLKDPIRDPDGKIIGTQLIFWDVTKEVVADRARKQAENELHLKNRDLSSLLYVISHDLKEPVRAIQSFSMLISDKYSTGLEEKARGFLTRVIDASRRMQQLLDDVLMLSRAQRTVEPTGIVNLQQLAEDVIAQTQARIDETQASVRIAGPLPVIRGDKRWLNQAVLNLVVNALKFTPLGQKPDIEIAAFEPPEGVLLTSGLIVKDRGPGVEEAHRERIFELFQRAVSRNVEGTGAGLAIVRQVAERHGGTAYVQPREGGGSEFVMTFNTARPEAV